MALIELAHLEEQKIPESYGLLMDDIERLADKIYNSFFAINPGDSLNINVVSHRSDADGLAAQVIWNQGLKAVADFLGVLDQGDGGVNIITSRVTGISSDLTNRESLESIVKSVNEAKGHVAMHIFADLGSLNPSDIESVIDKYGKAEYISVDHHPIKGLSEHVYTLNPWKHGIDGGEHFSAALLSSKVINTIINRIYSDYSGIDKKIDKRLISLKKKGRYLSILGSAGSSADMQSPTGLNENDYVDMEQKKVLKRVNHPFFGFTSKTSYPVIAESDVNINLKYHIPTKKEFNRFLNSMFGINGDYTPFYSEGLAMLFAVRKDDYIGANAQYLNTLPQQDVIKIEKELNSISKYFGISSHTYKGKTSFYLSYNGTEIETAFFDFLDDEKRYLERNKLVFPFLMRFGAETDKDTMLGDIDLDSLLEECRRNIAAFSDPELKELLLERLQKPQYLVIDDDMEFLAGKSVAEIANQMTSFSKTGHGGEFMQLVDYIFESFDTGKMKGYWLINHLVQVHRDYKALIYNGMRILEKDILDKNIDVLGNGAFHIPLEKLKKLAPDDTLVNMTGVYGGVICKNRLLPGDYGILFTSLDLGDHVKISGRTYLKPYHEVDLGSFYANLADSGVILSGGGHKLAASGYMDKGKLDSFFEQIRMHDFLVRRNGR